MNASKITVTINVNVSLDAVQYFLCIVKQIDGIHKNKNRNQAKCIEYANGEQSLIFFLSFSA